jgi:hypothetical protein
MAKLESLGLQLPKKVNIVGIENLKNLKEIRINVSGMRDYQVLSYAVEQIETANKNRTESNQIKAVYLR